MLCQTPSRRHASRQEASDSDAIDGGFPVRIAGTMQAAVYCCLPNRAKDESLMSEATCFVDAFGPRIVGSAPFEKKPLQLTDHIDTGLALDIHPEHAL